MAIWSHKKLLSMRNSLKNKDIVGGDGARFVPYALDGFRRTRCKECGEVFYCKVMKRFTYKARYKSVNLCIDCDHVKGRAWKRKQTREDEEIYLARLKAHGIAISGFKSAFN